MLAVLELGAAFLVLVAAEGRGVMVVVVVVVAVDTPLVVEFDMLLDNEATAAPPVDASADHNNGLRPLSSVGHGWDLTPLVPVEADAGRKRFRLLLDPCCRCWPLQLEFLQPPPHMMMVGMDEGFA